MRALKYPQQLASPFSKTAPQARAAVAPGRVKDAGSSAVAPFPPGRVRFAALDFETADYGRDSACSLSIVVVEDDAIIDTWTEFIRPPRREFVFTYLHGIAWEHVKDKPSFVELWIGIANKLESVSFVAAHNASFDRSVMRACCDLGGIEHPKHPFLCTVKAARAIWGFHPTTLADVCRQLEIPLRHHDAESDAKACARILLAARERGHTYDSLLKSFALKPARSRTVR